MAERCVTAGDGITSEAVNVILSCEDADRIVDALHTLASSVDQLRDQLVKDAEIRRSRSAVILERPPK
jgi:hypothetical protein